MLLIVLLLAFRILFSNYSSRYTDSLAIGNQSPPFLNKLTCEFHLNI